MDFKELAEKRRSVNYFDKQKDVPENLIREMIEIASNSPSGYNLQPWSIIILKDPEEKERLKKIAFNQPKVSEAPYVFILLADRDGWKEGNPFVEKNFRNSVESGRKKEEDRETYLNTLKKLYGETPDKQQAFAVKNTAFFAMSLMYAAKKLGLDTHPMDGFDHDAVRREFNIPDNYWIPLLLAVGHFDESKKLHPPNWRKTFDEIVVKF
jgi:nitroreductase